MDAGDAFRAVFSAQITGVAAGAGTFAGLNVYSWVEQIIAPATAGLAQAVPGRSGTATLSPALEKNNQLLPASSFPLNVDMRLRGMVGGVPVYEFAVPPAKIGGTTVMSGPIWPISTNGNPGGNGIIWKAAKSSGTPVLGIDGDINSIYYGWTKVLAPAGSVLTGVFALEIESDLLLQPVFSSVNVFTPDVGGQGMTTIVLAPYAFVNSFGYLSMPFVVVVPPATYTGRTYLLPNLELFNGTQASINSIGSGTDGFGQPSLCFLSAALTG